MARKRMIDPAIWDSEQVMELTPLQFKVFLYLISQADDEGRVKVSYPLFSARIFPLQDDYGSDHLKEDLLYMNSTELIQLYTDGKHDYVQHPHWTNYQTINKPKPSLLPSMDKCSSVTVVIPEQDGSDTVALPPNRIEGKGKEVNIAAPKDAKKKMPVNNPVDKSKEFYHSIKDSFESKHGEFDNYGREGKDINGLIEKAEKRFPEDPSNFIKKVLEAFWTLKKTGNDFWKGQPFLPSVLNSSSIWPRVLEQMREQEDEDIDDELTKEIFKS